MYNSFMWARSGLPLLFVTCSWDITNSLWFRQQLHVSISPHASLVYPRIDLALYTPSSCIYHNVLSRLSTRILMFILTGFENISA